MDRSTRPGTATFRPNQRYRIADPYLPFWLVLCQRAIPLAERGLARWPWAVGGTGRTIRRSCRRLGLTDQRPAQREHAWRLGHRRRDAGLGVGIRFGIHFDKSICQMTKSTFLATAASRRSMHATG